jgi:heparin binding hemagglutinin HbhA
MAKNTLPKPVYAYVGVTDLAVGLVRDLVTETQTRLAGVQKDVTARVADVQKTAVDPQALADRATTVVSARVDALAKDAKARREAIEARVAELQAEARAYPGKVQKLVDDGVDAATDTYADLVKRGETLVGRVRRQESTKATVASAKTTQAKAKTTATQARKAVDAETTATKRTATARKNAAKTTAKKAPAKKSTTKAAASKSTAAKTSASKSTASKSTAAKTATKAPARKAPTKQTSTAQSSAKATVTAAQKTAANATQAVTDAAEKVGD